MKSNNFSARRVINNNNHPFWLPNNKAFARGILTFSELFSSVGISTFTFNSNMDTIKEAFNPYDHILLVANNANTINVNNISVKGDSKDRDIYTITTRYRYVSIFNWRLSNIPTDFKFTYLVLGSSSLSFIGGFISGLVQMYGIRKGGINPQIIKDGIIRRSKIMYLTINNMNVRKISRKSPDMIRKHYVCCGICHNYYVKTDYCMICDENITIQCNVRVKLDNLLIAKADLKRRDIIYSETPNLSNKSIALNMLKEINSSGSLSDLPSDYSDKSNDTPKTPLIDQLD